MTRWGRRAATLLATVAIGVGLAGCSNEPSEAERVCQQLDRGTAPGFLLYGMDGVTGDPEATRAAAGRAVEAIRSDCPQHETAAQSLDVVVQAMAAAPTVDPGAGLENEGNATIAPEPTTLTLRVEGTATRATVQFSAGGSSGGGDEVDVPFTRQLTVTPDNRYSTVTAVTRMGTAGSLTCSITDDLGNVLSTQTASSQGGSAGYASVACSSS